MINTKLNGYYIKWKVKCLLLVAGIMACSSLWAQQPRAKFKAVPDYLKVQFAGGIGYISIGAGYETKNNKWEADLYYGYVPKNIGGVRIHSLTGKATWFPLKTKQYRTLQVKPLAFGLLANYVFGKQYFLFSPEYFPYSYYDFPTAAHIGGFIGGQINKERSSEKLFNKIGVYYELGTTDKELISLINNTHSLNIADVFNLGIGVKASF